MNPVGDTLMAGHRARTALPLSSSLSLGALPTATPCARLHTKAMLAEWDLGAVADNAELVVSELVTNATNASFRQINELALPVIHLRLYTDLSRLRIEVWDCDATPPTVTHAALEDESGRGLMLVQAMCDRWGSDAVPGWRGKVVWAELTCG